MNRNHTVEYYLSIYERLKKLNPKIEFSSDFIIAYPGEKEEDFEETMKLVKIRSSKNKICYCSSC